MKITDIRFYGGAWERITRLGLADLFIELQEILLSTQIFLLEQKDANGGAVVRKLIDRTFEERNDWVKKTKSKKVISGEIFGYKILACADITI